MATEIVYSNQIENLAIAFGKKMKESKCGIFAKEYIITQTAGMNQWLAIEMAKKENSGVFANFALINQDAFLNELYTLLTGNKLERNLETGKWILFNLLGSDEFKNNEEFKSVSEYYENDDLKRIQLAARLVDLFDQYQIYREEMFSKWDDNQLLYPDSDTEKWQQWLWEKLNAHSDHFFPKKRMKEEILNALKIEENIQLVKLKFPVVNFFGNSIYSPFHLEIYKALDNIIDFTHFVILPVHEIPEERIFKNELLVSLGGNSRELISMLKIGNDSSCSVEPIPDSLLHKIQYQIYNNQPLAIIDRITDEVLNDNSIQINSAYTEAREVEMLYNYLVDLKSKEKENLKPKDILVLTTDIDVYAPYIKAVFKNASYQIPYKISGISAGQKESIITALIKILDFNEDDFTSEKLVSLLETKSIASRFGFTDTSNIRDLVSKANIRFGRKGRVEDDTQYVSWEYGLKKLAFGYAMLTNESYDIPNEAVSIYPFEDLDGKSGQQIFRLKAFLDELGKVIDAKEETKTLLEWRKFISEEVLEKMIQVENTDKTELTSIYRQLNQQEEAEKIMTQPVSFNVFYQGIKSTLIDEAGEFGFNSGRVTFSSCIPARGLPCKVVAFLGLNSGKFPRKDKFLGFDLIAQETLLGDRSKKENDKQLFLDTILSAREYIYFSYIGKSVKDNSLIPPSIILDELMDYLENVAQSPEKVRSELLTEHPLHGFSGKYQQQYSRLFSYLYSGDQSDSDEKILLKDEAENGNQALITEIKLADLISFYKSPIKWFYQKSIGLIFEENDSLLKEKELFELNNLEAWALKNELLEIDIHDESLLEKVRDKYVKSGELPLKTFSIIEINKLIEDVKKVKETKDKLITGKSIISIGNILNISDNLMLTGSVSEVYGENLIAHSFSKNPLKYKIEAWIKYLFLRASGNLIETVFISSGGSSEAFNQITELEAINHLKLLAEYFILGGNHMISFTLNAAEDFKANNNVVSAYKKVEEEATYNKYNNQNPDAYIQKAIQDKQFGNLTNFEDYLKVLTPILINF